MYSLRHQGTAEASSHVGKHHSCGKAYWLLAMSSLRPCRERLQSKDTTLTNNHPWAAAGTAEGQKTCAGECHIFGGLWPSYGSP